MAERKLTPTDRKAIILTMGKMMAVAKMLSGKWGQQHLHANLTEDELAEESQEIYNVINEALQEHIFDDVDRLTQVFRKALDQCQKFFEE